MNLLDKLIKERILKYPYIYNARENVLLDIYCGNGTGYHWTDDGLLINIYADTESTIEELEEKCTSLFSDMQLGTEESHDLDYYSKPRQELELKQRQFVRDNIDLVTIVRNEPLCDPNLLMKIFHPDWCNCFKVPDNAEKSFKDGAIEVLNHLVHDLYDYYLEKKDRGFRKRVFDELERLIPGRNEKIKNIIQDFTF